MEVATAAATEPLPRIPRAGYALALALLAAAAYLPMVTHDFVTYDDQAYIMDNPTVRAGLTWRGVVWSFTTVRVSNWHPLTWLTHMLDIELFGLWAGGHHLVNLVLHAANSALVFLVLERSARVGWNWLGSTESQRRRLPWQAAAVAALFAVHPLHVESVAWVAERKDTLSTLFWLLAFGAYAAYADRPGMLRLARVVGFLALGLLAKPMLVTVPFALLLFDYWPLGRWQPAMAVSVVTASADGAARRAVPFWKLLLEKLPLFALALASSMVTVRVQGMGGALKSQSLYPWTMRIWNAIHSYACYLVDTLAPAELTFFYPYPPRDMLQRGITHPHLAAALVALVAITAAALWLGRKRRYLAVGWLWYVGTLVPVIGLVQVGDQGRADRYTYVPLLGIFIIAAWGLPDLVDALATRSQARRRGERALAVVGAALVAVGTTLTWLQLSAWRNSTTLYLHGIAVNPDNYVAYNNLGLVLCAQGKHAEALPRFQEAVRARPAYVAGHFNLALELEHLKRPKEAEEHYRLALRFNPRYGKARHNLAALLAKQGRFAEAEPHARLAAAEMPNSALAFHTYGTILLRQGRAVEAVKPLRRAVELDPRSAEAQSGVGLALLALGQPLEARRALLASLELKPAYPEPHLGLGDLAVEAGAWDQAAAHYSQAARFLPRAAEAYRKLAELELRRGRTYTALTWFEEAAKHDSNDPRIHEGFATTLEALGRADEAAAHRQTAERLRNR